MKEGLGVKLQEGVERVGLGVRDREAVEMVWDRGVGVRDAEGEGSEQLKVTVDVRVPEGPVKERLGDADGLRDGVRVQLRVKLSLNVPVGLPL